MRYDKGKTAESELRQLHKLRNELNFRLGRMQDGDLKNETMLRAEACSRAIRSITENVSGV